MTDSEYIIWKCDLLEEVRERHPDWSEAQVWKFFEESKAKLEKEGFLK